MSTRQLRHVAPASLTVPSFTRATVIAISETGERLDLNEEGQLRSAGIAFGCLNRPRPGDSVLVLREGGDSFVLQVLQRDGSTGALLALPGDGAIAVAGETLTLTGRGRLALRGDRLDLQGRSLALMAETTTWLGKAITGVVERFTLSARRHETSAGTLIEKAGDRTAVVDGTDSLRAETHLVKVTGIASETAQSKVVAVSEDLRMDGKRISMG